MGDALGYRWHRSLVEYHLYILHGELVGLFVADTRKSEGSRCGPAHGPVESHCRLSAIKAGTIRCE